MNILIIMHFIPYPPHTGGSVRIWELMKRISPKCNISVLCIADKKTIKNAKYIKPFCKNLYIVPVALTRNWREKALLLMKPEELRRFFKRVILVLQGVPIGVASLFHFNVRDKLREILSKEAFSIVQFEFVEMGLYLAHVNDLLTNSKSVLVEHDIMSIQKWRRLKYIAWPKKVFYMIDCFVRERWEKSTIKKFDHIIAVSELDKKKLVGYGINAINVSVIRTGVDIEAFHYNENHDVKPRMIFLGTQRYFANKDGLIWFIEEIFPKIKARIIDVELVVIGVKDPEICSKYIDPQIIFKGVVENLDKEMGNGAIFVAPIRIGAGVRVKIFTAMALGMPVVSTSLGIEGIDSNDDKGSIIADTPSGFADVVVSLFEDKQNLFRIGKNARRFMEQEYSYEKIADDLIGLYRKLSS